VNIDAEELLARIKRDYPTPYELSQLRLVIDKQAEQILRLQHELDSRDTPGPAHAAADDEGDPSYEAAYTGDVNTPAAGSEPVALRLRSVID
jgi:hypothetical protein